MQNENREKRKIKRRNKTNREKKLFKKRNNNNK